MNVAASIFVRPQLLCMYYMEDHDSVKILNYSVIIVHQDNINLFIEIQFYIGRFEMV